MLFPVCISLQKMPPDSSSEQDQDDSDEFVEIDPSERYGRVSISLRDLSSKSLYRSISIKF